MINFNPHIDDLYIKGISTYTLSGTNTDWVAKLIADDMAEGLKPYFVAYVKDRLNEYFESLDNQRKSVVE